MQLYFKKIPPLALHVSVTVSPGSALRFPSSLSPSTVTTTNSPCAKRKTNNRYSWIEEIIGRNINETYGLQASLEDKDLQYHESQSGRTSMGNATLQHGHHHRLS